MVSERDDQDIYNQQALPWVKQVYAGRLHQWELVNDLPETAHGYGKIM
jgi:hypothetical protein